jgi:hypothetical protein
MLFDLVSSLVDLLCGPKVYCLIVIIHNSRTLCTDKDKGLYLPVNNRRRHSGRPSFLNRSFPEQWQNRKLKRSALPNTSGRKEGYACAKSFLWLICWKDDIGISLLWASTRQATFQHAGPPAFLMRGLLSQATIHTLPFVAFW